MLLWLSACVDNPEPAPPSTTTTAPPLAVDWSDPGLDLEVGGGFRLRNCEGDAPLLCIERGGSTTGVIELTDHRGGDGQTLAQRVADHYATIADDRQQGCPAGYEFTTVPPVAATVAGRDGLRFGFTGRLADGRPSEKTVGFMTEQDDVVRVIGVHAYEADGCLPPEGAPFTTADLDAFEPFLDEIVAGSRLPDLAVFGP